MPIYENEKAPSVSGAYSQFCRPPCTILEHFFRRFETAGKLSGINSAGFPAFFINGQAMEENKTSIWDELKRIDLVSYLDGLGHQPKLIRNTDYWYYSPFRQEKTPII